MQCGELIYHNVTKMTKSSRSQSRPEKESIHSGHFMVSHFEAEAQDDEDDLAVPVPEEDGSDSKVALFGQIAVGTNVQTIVGSKKDEPSQQQISIETSLNKLFQCMTLAYRQKLTSPKWNRFKGIKLRWKDKIRLNNVIWRCWHMQFIMKQNTLVCQFASPLDVDTHIKPEATILEGKYWKRRAEAVKAEYKKWRMYYRNRALGWGNKDVSDVISDMDVLENSQGDILHMLVDEDYIEFMSDTLFSTISSNQPFAFPDTREIARVASLADFIQPSLGPLQPNLEDFMDTLEPLQDFLSSKLPPVPEEVITPDDHVYRNTYPPALLDSNLQQALDQTPQYQNTQMQTQHMQRLPSHMSSGHSGQMMSQGSLTAGIQSISPNSSGLENQQSTLNNLLGRQRENQSYVSQATNQTTGQPNSNLISNMVGQAQPMMMQQSSYCVHPSNMMNQQNNVHTSGTMMRGQDVLSNAQHQMQKNPQQQYMQNNKMYQHSVSGYQERNYTMSQGMHQGRQDAMPYGASNRPNSGSGNVAYNPERNRRPLAPSPARSYGQYAGTPPQPVADKSSYNEECMEHGLSTAQPQQIKAGIYVSTIPEQNSAANLSLTGSGRFKMPSPPPQSSNNPLRSPSGSQKQQQQQPKKQVKCENFRSNSLPLGATIGSVMGAGSGSMGSGTISQGTRPRSGSSSPAPPPRRGPAPLLATTSEPLLREPSVLLAHLLNSKGQGLYKPNSTQSLVPEAQQPHPVAIIQASPLVLPVSSFSSTTQLLPFGGSSPTSAPSPQSPLSPCGEGSRGGEHRRAGHIQAEQKRRYNIKYGFDLLQTLIPQLAQNPNAKVSKAAMLQKGAEYIRQLQAERSNMKDEIDKLRQQIETLNNSISNCQSLLPATGASVSRQHSGRLREMFDEYVCQRTNENWKFWIFSLLVEPLLTSFNNCVSPASTEELKRSTYLWAEQHCSLVEMRPAVLNSLRALCTSTEILSEPEKLPDEARAAVNNKRKDSLYNLKK